VNDWRLFRIVTLPLSALNVINTASRAVMAIIGPLLAVEFSLTGSELGFLGACMLAAYAIAQLPGGMALDRLGPRRVQAALSLTTAAGFALFAVADGVVGFAVARAVIGLGIALGLVALIKASAQWFDRGRVAAMTGIGVALGGLGSVLATTPVAAVLPSIGWRGVSWVLCALSLASAIWIFISVPDKAAANPGSLRRDLSVLASIWRTPIFWRFGSVAAMVSVLNFTYLGLWAGPWLRDVAGYEGQARANTLLMYALTMTVGALVVGAAASRATRRGLPLSVVPLACNAGQILAQVGLALQPGHPAVITLLWMLFALCVAGAAPGYVALGQLFPPEQTGRVSTAVNTLTLGGAFLLQSSIGWILDLWPRTASGGWHPNAYSAALALSIVIQALLAFQLIRMKR
jgi:MFS family permease